MQITSITYLFVAILCLTPRVSNAQTEMPDFFTTTKVDAAEFASAVNQFVELGETETVRVLKALRSKPFRGKVDLQLRVACICRVLWQNSDDPIPPPTMGMYGGGVSIGSNQSEKLKDWPLFPVAKAGDSYFVVVHGGRGGTGISHRPPSGYLKKCQTSGSFLTEKIAVPSKQDADENASQLRKSARWRKEFSDKGDDRKTWKSIESQIPNKTK